MLGFLSIVFYNVKFIHNCMNLLNRLKGCILVYIIYFFDFQKVGFQYIYKIELYNTKDFYLEYIIGIDGIGLVFITLSIFILNLCYIEVKDKYNSKFYCLLLLSLEFFLINAFISLDLFFFSSSSKVF
jgi:NADH:ubiquinone oxidoreductase subunit 4 (subunit M)